MDTGNVWVYPNPVTPEYQGMINVTGLSFNSDVKITSSNGTLVAQGRSTGGSFSWDGTTPCCRSPSTTTSRSLCMLSVGCTFPCFCAYPKETVRHNNAMTILLFMFLSVRPFTYGPSHGFRTDKWLRHNLYTTMQGRSSDLPSGVKRLPEKMSVALCFHPQKTVHSCGTVGDSHPIPY